jgi:hypothetical protein
VSDSKRELDTFNSKRLIVDGDHCTPKMITKRPNNQRLRPKEPQDRPERKVAGSNIGEREKGGEYSTELHELRKTLDLTFSIALVGYHIGPVC